STAVRHGEGAAVSGVAGEAQHHQASDDRGPQAWRLERGPKPAPPEYEALQGFRELSQFRPQVDPNGELMQWLVPEPGWQHHQPAGHGNPREMPELHAEKQAEMKANEQQRLHAPPPECSPRDEEQERPTELEPPDLPCHTRK